MNWLTHLVVIAVGIGGFFMMFAGSPAMGAIVFLLALIWEQLYLRPKK